MNTLTSVFFVAFMLCMPAASMLAGEKQDAHAKSGYSLINFGELSIGVAEEEFVRAYPNAERDRDQSTESGIMRVYYLVPPDSLDADRVSFIFVEEKLIQIDHNYGKERLEERGGWQTDYEALSDLFGHTGKSIPRSSPESKTKLAFIWNSKSTREAASLSVYPNKSSQVSFYLMHGNAVNDGSLVNGIRRGTRTSSEGAHPSNEPAPSPQQQGKLVSFGNRSEVIYQRNKSEAPSLALTAPVDTLAKVIDYRTGRLAAMAWICSRDSERAKSQLWLGVPEGLYKVVYAQEIRETTAGEFFASYYGKLANPVEIRSSRPTSIKLSIYDAEYVNVKSSAKEFGSFRPTR